ncbi:MAG: hypothetical protein R3C58_10905 [Parvularculaceae bacterium]
MGNHATFAATAVVGALALGLTSAHANPLTRGGSTVSMNSDSTSSSARQEAAGVLDSIFDNVFSVRFGAKAATTTTSAEHDARECDEKKKESSTAARPQDEEKKDEKEAVGPEPIYFGF